MADLAGVAVGAGLDAVADADGAGDARTEGDEEEAVGAVARADPAFGEAAGADVVAEGDGDAVESAAEEFAHGNVAPAEVGGVDGDAVLRVDDAGDGDSGGRGGLAVPLLAEGAELRGEAEDRLHDGLGAALAPGGAAGLVEQGAVRPTRAAFMPVPPTSRAMTCLTGDGLSREDPKGLVHCRGLLRTDTNPGPVMGPWSRLRCGSDTQVV